LIYDLTMTDGDWFQPSTTEPLIAFLRSQPPSDRATRAVFLYAAACYRLNWDAHDPSMKMLVEMLEARSKTRSEPVAVKSFLSPLTTLFAGDLTGAISQVFALSSAGAWAMAQMATDTTRALGADAATQADLLREFCPPPSFAEKSFSHDWLSESVQILTRSCDHDGDFTLLPILADSLEEAGCRDQSILDHGRATVTHRHGCWVIDGLVGAMGDCVV
jgi:hypothetical protein